MGQVTSLRKTVIAKETTEKVTKAAQAIDAALAAGPPARQGGRAGTTAEVQLLASRLVQLKIVNGTSWKEMQVILAESGIKAHYKTIERVVRPLLPAGWIGERRKASQAKKKALPAPVRLTPRPERPVRPRATPEKPAPQSQPSPPAEKPHGVDRMNF